MKRRSWLLIIVGVGLLISSIFLIHKNLNESRQAEIFSANILMSMPSMPPAEETEIEDTIETEDGTFVGTIEIPKLEIELPVFDQWSYDNLKKAPCRYMGHVKTNDMIIAAHNYARHFGGLYKLDPGDIIFFMNQHTNYRYVVTETEIISGQDIESLLDREDFDLTLYTCKLNHKDRVVVRATLSPG